MIQETQPYDLGIIRKLLLAAFTAEELRRFCQDNPAFRPIVDRFGPAHGLDDMVDEVVAYCQTQLLLDQLLLHVREVNPRHYARFARDLGIPLAQALPEVACPYRGLEPFEAEHAEFYFGREAMVETLLDRVRDHSFVAVVGPSGCGKSSLVRAGLVTALRAGALPGSEQWAVRIFYPGADPLRALAAPLVDLLEPEASEVTRLEESRKLADGLRQGTVLLADVAARLRELYPERPRLLLLADQFEELYTECRDEAVRAAFVAALLAAAKEKNIAVILTLRADFYGHVLANRPLGEAVDAGLANVLPMDEVELREAIEQPALRTGRAFEPGLVERIAGDVAGEPGNLPLLEFALTELWARQTAEGLLTHAAYEAIGGVAGAIARRAEEEYANLAARGQGETVRRLLLRLTHYGEATAETRRRATLGDLVTPRTPQAEVEAAVRALADARLLVTGKEATVEVSHEALIRGWERLRHWLDEDRAFGLWRERLAAARQTWQETARDEGVLLRGAPLAEAEGWLAGRGDDLNEAERAFVAASLALREREAAEREAQRERELAAAQRLAGEQKRRAEEQARANRLFRRLVIILAVVFLLAVGAAVVAGVLGRQAADNAATAEAAVADLAAEVVVRSTAEAEAGRQADALSTQVVRRSTAEALALDREATAVAAQTTAIAYADAEATARADANRQAQLALSRQLAAQSARELDRNQYEVALPLAIEAGQAADTSEAFAALRQAIAHPGRTRLILSDHGDAINHAVWSADEDRILTASRDGTARVWDVATGAELLTLAGHTDQVMGARWNADESRILTAGCGQTDDVGLCLMGTARVSDAATGAELLTIAGHKVGINQAVWNADESRILTTGCDQSDTSGDALYCSEGTARVWDAATGVELLTLSGHEGEVIQAAWNADESRILTTSLDGTARVWDAATGYELLVLAGHNVGINQAAWNADGSRILTTGCDQSDMSVDAVYCNEGTARVWDAATGVELLTLSGHERAVNQAVWNADESRILTASADGTARMWDAATGAELLTFSGHGGEVVQAAWNAGESRILTASSDGTARVWDAATGTELFTLFGHERAINQAVWNADESRILTASDDGTARVWDVAMGAELLTLSGHEGAVYRAVWNADESRILTASADGTARVWDTVTGAELLTFAGHEGSVVQAAWNADESRVLTASADGTARVWDAATAAELLTLSSHEGEVIQAAWNADESRILTASLDGTARVWDAATGNELLTLSGHSRDIYQAVWNADGSRILTASWYSRAQVWDAATGDELLTLSGYKAKWNANESRILTASPDGTARVWDAATGAELLTLSGHEDEVIRAAWNADESRILTAGADGTARVWDAATGAELLILAGHGDKVYQAIWNADESRILTAGCDQSDSFGQCVVGTARVWDAATGAELFTLAGHEDTVYQATWNADESRILTAGGDGIARLWYTRMEDLIEAACRIAPRNFTSDEWQQYMKGEAYRATCENLPLEQ